MTVEKGCTGRQAPLPTNNCLFYLLIFLVRELLYHRQRTENEIQNCDKRGKNLLCHFDSLVRHLGKHLRH